MTNLLTVSYINVHLGGTLDNLIGKQVTTPTGTVGRITAVWSGKQRGQYRATVKVNRAAQHHDLDTLSLIDTPKRKHRRADGGPGHQPSDPTGTTRAQVTHTLTGVRRDFHSLTNYGLRVTVNDDGTVKFTITSAEGTKQHANVTISATEASLVAKHLDDTVTTNL